MERNYNHGDFDNEGILDRDIKILIPITIKNTSIMLKVHGCIFTELIKHINNYVYTRNNKRPVRKNGI